MPHLNLDKRDERLLDILAPDATLEVVISGFKFTEGPAWHPTEQHLTFSDIIGNSTLRWWPDGTVEDIRPNSHLGNGNTYDRQGRLLTCHHGTSRVTRMEPDGSITVLATHYQGQQLNSPNDIVVCKDGSIYFTDPSFGRMEKYGIPREQDLPFCGVFRLDPESGDLTLLANDFDKPNGLCFAPDESRLFVNDSWRSHIRVFDILPGGTLIGGEVWATLTGEGVGVPDGMKFDSAGILYVCGPGGVHVFAPDATCLGVIGMPEHAANFCWGGADLRSLYITASTSVYRVRVRQPGFALF